MYICRLLLYVHELLTLNCGNNFISLEVVFFDIKIKKLKMEKRSTSATKIKETKEQEIA